MQIGKVPENVLKRSVFKQIKLKRDEVLIHPGVGEDCSVLELAPGEVFVLSTDPITGAASDIGTLAVHVTANDLASAGGYTFVYTFAARRPGGRFEIPDAGDRIGL